MKVKILKCTGGDWWYADHIGDIVEVADTIDEYGNYNVVHVETQYPENCFLELGISKYDCEVVDDTKVVILNTATGELEFGQGEYVCTLDEAKQYIEESDDNPLNFKIIEVTGVEYSLSLEFVKVS